MGSLLSLPTPFLALILISQAAAQTFPICDADSHICTAKYPKDYLDLRWYGLTGTIPTEMFQHTQLTHIKLYRNELSGTIPTEIGRLTNLQQLILFGNSLSGTLPTEIGRLTQLQRLELNENSLSGTVPSEIAKLTRLHHLWLFDNKLVGQWSREVGELFARLRRRRNGLEIGEQRSGKDSEKDKDIVKDTSVGLGWG